jgi:hypothetical protein
VARPLSPNLVALWRDRVARQAVSGLTIVQFCTQERCARSAFHRWKRHFECVGSSGGPPTLPATSGPHPTRAARSAFLPVTVRIMGSNATELPPVEADLPNGIRLRVSVPIGEGTTLGDQSAPVERLWFESMAGVGS